jgi:hypothetical protein
MENAKTQGSDIVLRGLMLLALMLVVVVGGFALLFRFGHANHPVPTVAVEAEKLAPMLIQPAASFPDTLAWATAVKFVEELPSQPGWRIRYQVARNFASRGSSKVDWTVYREMLDEQRQFRNFRVRLDDGRLVTQEGAARQIIIGALKDLATWHKEQKAPVPPSDELRSVYAAVDKLSQSEIHELRVQAEKTRGTFFPIN